MIIDPLYSTHHFHYANRELEASMHHGPLHASEYQWRHNRWWRAKQGTRFCAIYSTKAALQSSPISCFETLWLLLLLIKSGLVFIHAYSYPKLANASNHLDRCVAGIYNYVTRFPRTTRTSAGSKTHHLVTIECSTGLGVCNNINWFGWKAAIRTRLHSFFLSFLQTPCSPSAMLFTSFFVLLISFVASCLADDQPARSQFSGITQGFTAMGRDLTFLNGYIQSFNPANATQYDTMVSFSRCLEWNMTNHIHV